MPAFTMVPWRSSSPARVWPPCARKASIFSFDAGSPPTWLYARQDDGSWTERYAADVSIWSMGYAYGEASLTQLEPSSTTLHIP